MRRILFDVEADGLLDTITRIHCICTVNVDTEETRDFGPNQIKEALQYLGTADVLIAHNGESYDFRAVEKVHGFRIPYKKRLDTLVLARTKRPNVKETDTRFNASQIKNGKEPLGSLTGKHSLEAWGVRLGVPKLHTTIDDWSQWTPQIQDRCHGDVQTNLKLWKHLDPDNMHQGVVELEHRVQRLCLKMTDEGWPFDIKAAGAFHAQLVAERDEVEAALRKQFGGWYKPKNKQQPFVPKRDNKKLGYIAGAPCTQIEWVEFNPGSREHIENRLRKLGWEPEEFLESGKAKLEEEQLDGIAVLFPQAAGITRYLLLTKRLGQLAEGPQAWLKKATVDGRIHCQYNTMGTITSRAAHYDPNLAQVPSSASEYGHECRSLFTAPEGMVLLGADMAGLEGRCLAHYLAKYDGGEYGSVLLSGDPHWNVAKALGLAEGERDKTNQLHTIVREQGAKRGFYAMLYGAGAAKVGRVILDCCRLAYKTNPEWGFLAHRFFDGEEVPGNRALQKVGAQAKRDVIEGIPGFAQLMTAINGILMDCEDKGRPLSLPGLDGRRLPVRSEHSALNVLLQSAGAILCKRWITDAYDALIEAGYKWGRDFVFLGWIHDELQAGVRPELVEKIGAIIVRCAQEAGKPYGFRIALDSSYKTGASWADTH